MTASPEGLLVVNAGSATIKFALYEAVPGAPPALRYRGLAERTGATGQVRVRDHAGGMTMERNFALAAAHASGPAELLPPVIEWIGAQLGGLRLIGAGHRVVHGGDLYQAPVRVDAGVLAQLDRLSALAPLHQPHNLAAIRALEELQPGLPQVACFDTAFHRTQPRLAQMFALPRRYWDEGVKAYGFHGLSYASICRQLPAHLGPLADGKVVIAHLGNGASLCALRERASVASTMGFTALDGLMMATRCGSLDPGVVLHLLAAEGATVESVSDLLYARSGLLGVSGLSGDMRSLLASAAPEAAEAIALFVQRIHRQMGAMAAALQGLDAVVFTGGIGENAPDIRARVCEGMAWLGLHLDHAANAGGCSRISLATSKVSAWALHTDEEAVIAEDALALLQRGAADTRRASQS